ncbi:MAG: hypothetical protein ACUVRK_13265, partial [Spirochaetota bacterium]
MILLQIIKIIVTVCALIFCSFTVNVSLLGIFSCTAIIVMYYSYIPKQQRYLLLISIPLTITIASIQLLTSLIVGTIDIQTIFITSFKIIVVGFILIGSRFFIGIPGLKVVINNVPQTIRLFLLIFMRTLYKLLQLNKMIVFQLQSRINFKSKDKYYIPKYYSVAMLYNQFYAFDRYRNGILSRDFDILPKMVIEKKINIYEIITVIVISMIIIINC